MDLHVRDVQKRQFCQIDKTSVGDTKIDGRLTLKSLRGQPLSIQMKMILFVSLSAAALFVVLPLFLAQSICLVMS